MEELTDNAEEPDEAESKQSEVKLGKLQYKVYIVICYNKFVVTKELLLNIFRSAKLWNKSKKIKNYCVIFNYINNWAETFYNRSILILLFKI